MFSLVDAAALVALEQARAQRRFFTGHLYAPSDVAAISEERGIMLQPGWYLGGAVHPAMWLRIQGGDCSYDHSSFVMVSPAGGMYAVFGQRLGEFEHRFVLALAGEEGERFLAGVSKGGISFTLADADGAMATVFRGPKGIEPELPDGCAVPPLPQDEGEFLAMMQDAAFMAVSLLQPELPPAAAAATPRTSPAHVCVSSVFGEECARRLVRELMPRMGAGPHLH